MLSGTPTYDPDPHLGGEDAQHEIMFLQNAAINTEYEAEYPPTIDDPMPKNKVLVYIRKCWSVKLSQYHIEAIARQ